jgi:hypothetical protein
MRIQCVNKSIKTIILIVFWFAISTYVYADVPTRVNNTFFVNGKNYEFTNSQLAKIRESWKAIKTNYDVPLKLDDKQWVFDFIAIDRFYNTPSCSNLILDEINARNSMTDTIDGKKIKAWGFDEAWSITACGEKYVYRVYVTEGTYNLSIYQMYPRLKIMPGSLP